MSNRELWKKEKLWEDSAVISAGERTVIKRWGLMLKNTTPHVKTVDERHFEVDENLYGVLISCKEESVDILFPWNEIECFKTEYIKREDAEKEEE